MKHNTTDPQTNDRYREIKQIQKELGLYLEHLFELPTANKIFYNAEHLVVITTNELLIYSIPSLETIYALTHYDAKKAGIPKRKKWAPWFEVKFREWSSEKGLTLND